MATAVSAAHPQALPALRHTPLSLWHLLSLDASSVAALWTVFLARSFHVTLPWPAPLALGLAVWMLYAADRLSDAARNDTTLEERHRFHRNHRTAFLGLIAGCVPLLALLVALLPAPLRRAWLLMALPLAAYAAAVHGLRLRRVPKEHLVAIFFALACSAPEWAVAHTAWRVLVPVITMFGAVCWLNCAAIARWEHAPSTTMDAVTAWTARYFRAATLLIAAMATAIALTTQRETGAAIATAALLLLLLDRVRSRLTPLTLRACADAALLLPLAYLPIIWLLARV